MPRGNDDGTNDRAPEGTQMPTSPGGPGHDDYSRRKFLRAAVIGTAGVAGAAGVGGFVLAQRGGSLAPGLVRIGVLSTISAHTTYTPCFEDTGFNDVDTLSGSGGSYNANASYFAVLGIHSLPQGATFTIDVQQELVGDSHGYQPIQGQVTGKNTTPGYAPFAYQSNGNNALAWYEKAGSIAAACPYSKPSADTTADAKGSGAPFTFAPSGTGTTDVTFFLHLSWGASVPTSSETVNIQISLYAGSSASGTPLFQQVLPLTVNP